MNIHHKGPQNRVQTPVSQPELDEICRVLNGILSDGVDVHRCLAARASGRIGAPASVQPLIAALLDEDEDVRTDAAEALLELADPRAAQQLLENLLGDPCTEVKLAAIESLAKLQDAKVIPWLRRMVKGRDEEIVWDEEEFYSSGWDDWVDIQIRAVDALAELNAGEAVPDIVAAIREEDSQDMTEAAFRALTRVGKPGIKALACFLEEDSSRLRRRAAAALAATDAEEAAEPLGCALADPSSEVRIAAMRALAVRAPADARLAALLEDTDSEVRAEAVQLCGRHHADRLPALIDDPSKGVQVAALKILARMQKIPTDEALVVMLREKLAQGTGEITAASARALVVVSPQAAEEELIPLLGDAARPVKARLGALNGLATLGSGQAVEALVSVIDDDMRAIRLETMSALAWLARDNTEWPNAAGDALLSALRGVYEPQLIDPEEPVSEDSEPEPVTVTENEDDAGAFPTSTLNSILDDVPGAREVVGLPDEGIELTPTDMERLALAKRIKGKKRVQLAPKVVLHKDIRRFAARVLGDIYHTSVAHELAVALKYADAEVSMAAADSLARIGEHLNPLPDDVTQIMMATAQAANRDLKLLLIRALAAADGGKVTDFLTDQIHDEDSFVRAEAVRAFTRLGRTGPEVEGLLDDPDPSVRLSAAEAVAAAGGDGALKLLVDFAFSFEGYHGRPAARLLRDLDAAPASALFIDVLQDPERKRVWSVAIEALEELNCLQPVWTAEVPDRDQRR